MCHVFALFFLCWWGLIGVFGSEKNTNETHSVMEGDWVTLDTGVGQIRDRDDTLWSFLAENSSVIAQLKSGNQTFPYDGFRHRLKLDEHTGSLTIANITTEHTGRYDVKITGNRKLSKTFIVSVYARLPVPVVSNSSRCSSSSSLQNCSVLCSVVNVSHVTLSLLKGHSLLSSISVSDLSISLSLPLEVEDQDTNNYSCVLNNSITHRTTHLDISAVCHACADQGLPSSHTLLISAGSLVFVSAVVITVWICRRHRKTQREVEPVETPDEEITYAEVTINRGKAKKSIVGEESVVYAAVSMTR